MFCLSVRQLLHRHALLVQDFSSRLTGWKTNRGAWMLEGPKHRPKNTPVIPFESTSPYWLLLTSTDRVSLKLKVREEVGLYTSARNRRVYVCISNCWQCSCRRQQRILSLKTVLLKILKYLCVFCHKNHKSKGKSYPQLDWRSRV